MTAMKYRVISGNTLLGHYEKLTIQHIMCLDPPLIAISGKGFKILLEIYIDCKLGKEK